MNDFKEKVYAATRIIPEGMVSTYGHIAKYIGNEKAARAVGNVLHNNPDPDYTPCFRIVNRAGRLADNFGYGGIEEQKRRLENDGIRVSDYHVDLNKYLYDFREDRK